MKDINQTKWDIVKWAKKSFVKIDTGYCNSNQNEDIKLATFTSLIRHCDQ